MRRADGGFDPVDFLARAVRTPSHEDVTAMTALLVDELAAHGREATVDDAGNVLASRGTGDPHYVLNTHVDTVSPHVPFERVETPDGDVVRGRGACDAKGPLAALLAAFLAVDPGEGRVTLAVTPDEETLSTGAAALDLDADGYVVGEPTGLDACTAAKGRFEATVRLSGRNAHAAEPETGVNAVAAAGPALTALDGFDDRPGATPSHPDLGSPALTPTVVRGGDATNQVPDDCAITVDRRAVPPETADGFRAGLETYLRERIPDDVGLSVALAERETPLLGPWATPVDADVVAALLAAGAGEARPFTAATEASYFAADAPTVVFGPGVLADGEGAVAHADREYVRVADVERAGRVLAAALDRLVG